jgi:replicative DNA helicase
LVKDKAVTILREIDSELLLDEGVERNAYDYVRRHFEENRALPSAATVADNTGIVLPPPSEPATYYLRRVRERALTNNLLQPYNRLQDALQNPRKSMAEMQDAIDEMYRHKSRFLDAGTGIEMSDSLLDDVRRRMMESRMSGGVLRGITTGYAELDQTMDGYNPGDLVVWVGRPGRAKSWFLLKQAHAGWMSGYRPLYISMEMGGLQNMRRLIGIHSGINPQFIKRGQIQSMALPVFNRAVDELLAQRPLHMVTANFSRTVEQVANFVDQYSPDIVYIDAGYLLSPKKKRYGSGGRRETISDVIEEIKELSANSNIPFVITVQFNRQAEHRRRGADSGSFNPIAHLSLAEIGETDVIGQAASHVLGIEYPPDPLPRDAYRAFGFLKGREGENGWWLTRFMEHQHSPVDLSLIPRDDPVYQQIIDHARQAGASRRDPRSTPPEHRSRLMQINQ